MLFIITLLTILTIINTFEVIIYDYIILKESDGFTGYLKTEYNYDSICVIKIVSGVIGYNETLDKLEEYKFGTKIHTMDDNCIKE